MGYIGGGLHRAFVERIRGVEPERLLAVPIDVGKHTAAGARVRLLGRGPRHTLHVQSR